MAVGLVVLAGGGWWMYASYFRAAPAEVASTVPADATSPRADIAAAAASTPEAVMAVATQAVESDTVLAASGTNPVAVATPDASAHTVDRNVASNAEPAPVAPAPRRVTPQPAPPAAKPAPRQQVEPGKTQPSAEARLRALAARLVGKGEKAFQQKNYGAAITNAKAALDARPGYPRAKRLLRDAQTAQERAMNSITIH